MTLLQDFVSIFGHQKFLNKHKQKDIIKYKQIFLEKMKLFLSYFIQFFNNRSILLKIYFENYVVDI